MALSPRAASGRLVTYRLQASVPSPAGVMRLDLIAVAHDLSQFYGNG